MTLLCVWRPCDNFWSMIYNQKLWRIPEMPFIRCHLCYHRFLVTIFHVLLFKVCFYLFERHRKGTRKRERIREGGKGERKEREGRGERERVILSHLLVCPQSHNDRVEPDWSVKQGASSRFLPWVQKSTGLDHPPLPSRHSSRELKWSSWDFNWYPYGLPAEQVVALLVMSWWWPLLSCLTHGYNGWSWRNYH